MSLKAVDNPIDHVKSYDRRNEHDQQEAKANGLGVRSVLMAEWLLIAP
ncbi:MAG: hypothetical protein ACREJU_08265 [Nitrospiraceae bacterium]